MATSDPLAMRVEDVFHLSDGRTVFVGPLAGRLDYVHGAECELLHNGTLVDRFTVYIELSDPPDPDPTRQAVSTFARVALTRENMAEGEWALRFGERRRFPESFRPS